MSQWNARRERRRRFALDVAVAGPIGQSPCRLRCRSGATLAELITAMLSLALLAAITAAFFRVQTRVATAVGHRAESLDAVRTVVGLAGRELRHLAPGDFVGAGDSVALRAFRGSGVVCDTAGGQALVRYSGIRDPDPAKDSLLIAGAAEHVAPLLSSAAGASALCLPASGERILSVRTDRRLAPGAAVAVFERGTYLFAGSALRYRRGAAGRQPVTADVFDAAASGFTPHMQGSSGAATSVRLVPAIGAANAPRPVLPVDVRVSQPNGDTLAVRP